MENETRKSIGKWISILHRQSQIYINNELKSYDINSSEYIYIVNLAQHEGVNQKCLSDMIIIDDALTTRVMKSLEQKGYIIREKNFEDKRAYNVRLTAKGREVQPIILAKLRRWTEILSRDMSREEVDFIYEKLKLMSNNALHFIKGDRIKDT